MLILDDNALLRFGSTNDPAYLMTISALPQMIAPIMNLRHTALVQSAMEEILQIPKHRGVIRFESMLEENFATNGATIKDEIEQMNRSSHEDHNNLFRTISRTMTRRSKASVTTNATRTVAPNISRRTPVERISTGDDIPEASISKGSLAETEKEKRIKKYRSIAKLFSH